MARAMWKGNISFGMELVPVTMHSAEEPAAQLDLDMLDSRDGSRVRYKRVNEKTGQEVPWKSVTKGVLRDDEYVVLTDADFKKAAEKVVRGIEIQTFVPVESISPLYYQKPYYLAPGKGGDKAYALLRDTLEKTGQVGIAKAVIHTREHLAALMVVDGIMTLLLLRFEEELRSPADLDIPRVPKSKASARELTMAQQLVKGMAGKWEPEEFHDEYRDALKKYIAAKVGTGVKAPKKRGDEESDAPVTYNIMELLKESVRQQGKPAAKGSKSRSTKTSRPTRAPRASRATRTRRKAG